jgi:hypothetical protein
MHIQLEKAKRGVILTKYDLDNISVENNYICAVAVEATCRLAPGTRPSVFEYLMMRRNWAIFQTSHGIN